MRREVELDIRGKWNPAHLSENNVPASDDSAFRETMIPTWFLPQREGRSLLPMSLLFCGGLLGSTATCGTPPMRGERDDVTPGQREPRDKRQEMSKKDGTKETKNHHLDGFWQTFEEWTLIYLHFSIAAVDSKVSGLHPNPAGIKCFCSRSN